MASGPGELLFHTPFSHQSDRSGRRLATNESYYGRSVVLMLVYELFGEAPNAL